MSKIEVGQFSSLLRRYLGMTGVSDVVDELAPEVSATFPLEVERPEWEYLKGAKLMGFGGTQPLNAALQSGFRLRNPPTTGVVAVFSTFIVSVSAPTRVFIGYDTVAIADLATVLQSTPRDSRFPLSANPDSAIIPSSANVNPGGFNFIDISMNDVQQRPYTVNVPFVLTPGNTLTCWTNSINVTLSLTAIWLEKKLPDLETK